MATVTFPTSDAKTVTKWSEGTEAEALKKVSWLYFTGRGSDQLCQWKDELSKGAGDTITYSLRMQLTDAPRTSSDSLEGNERSLTYYSRSIVIDESVDAVRFKNRIDTQRVAFDVRSDARDALADQHSNAIDTSFFNQIGGYEPATSVAATLRGNNTAVDYDSSHVVFGGSGNAADEDLTTGDDFTLELIDQAVTKAKTSSPSIRPARIDFMGRDLYVCFVHPDQMAQLREASTRFDTLNQAILQGGRVDDNPLIAGNTMVYNDTLIVENTRVPNGYNSSTGAVLTNVRRAIFCGAQAAAIAWGRQEGVEGRFNWVEVEFDYGREYGVSAGCIYGLQKNIFNSADFGTIVIASDSPVV